MNPSYDSVVVCYGLYSSDVKNSFEVPIHEINDFVKGEGKSYEEFIQNQIQRRKADPTAKPCEYQTGFTEFYERTQPANLADCAFYNGTIDSDRIVNRVYVDIDGRATCDSRKEFKELNETIITTLHFHTSDEHSIMVASKYSEGQSKLSYRITLLKKHGSKAAIVKYVEEVLYPAFKDALVSENVPLEMKTEKNKRQLQEDKYEEQPTFLLIDSGVYNPRGRKMRMVGQSKPNENRPNVIVELDGKQPDVIDTLITWIPADSEALPEPEAIVEEPKKVIRKAEPVAPKADEPKKVVGTIDLTPDQTTLYEVMDSIGLHRWNNYDDFITLGFITKNEDLPFEVWETLAKKGAKNKPGDCLIHWSKPCFKKTANGFTQATLWKWLKEDNRAKFDELIKKRTDFWTLIKNPNHANTARYFYNLKPEGYVYNEALGWFQLLPTNAWKQYEKAPSGLLMDINKTLKQLADDHAHLIRWDSKGEEKDPRKDDFVAFQKIIGNKTFVDGVIGFLPACYNVDDLVDKMDESRHLFAFADKVYDLKERTYRPIRPMDYVCLHAGYNAPSDSSDVAVRKEIQAVLHSIFENPQMEAYVLRSIAVCLYGENKFETFNVWTGKGGNGKGVLMAFVKKVFGNYYHSIPQTILTKPFNGKNEACPAIAQSRGKRFCGTQEPESSDAGSSTSASERIQFGFVKELTGNDDITARKLFKDSFTFKPQFGLFLQTNGIPKLNSISGAAAIKRRMRILKFPFNFVENPTMPHERRLDYTLKDKIGKNTAWRDEFLRMLIETYYTIGDSLEVPTEVSGALDEYLNEQNPVSDWIQANYTKTTDFENEMYWINTDDLRDQLKADTGNSVDATKFKAGMEALGFVQKRINLRKNRDYWDDEEGKILKRDLVAGIYWVGIERKRMTDEEREAKRKEKAEANRDRVYPMFHN